MALSSALDMETMIQVVHGYEADQEAYLRRFVVTINGKRRKLVTYAKGENGKNLRAVHTYVEKLVTRVYQRSSASFAYAKKKNIVDCANMHLHSNTFLKTDIHSYFDSITYEGVVRALKRRKHYAHVKDELSVLIKACFYQGRLPLGFVSSPVISDLFLASLDRKYHQRKDIVYTRYADDFIISTNDNEALLSAVCEELKQDLAQQALTLNPKKTYIRTLKQEGDAIHVLGINLVKTNTDRNRITVSDRYLRKTCMNLAELLKFNGDEEEKKELCDTVCGQIAFIHMCSEDSMKKLKKMAHIKCNYVGEFHTKAIRAACGFTSETIF